MKKRHHQISMFSRYQIWRILPLRYSSYKQKLRSHSFKHGNKQRSILSAREMVDQILGSKNFILQKLPTSEIIISTPTLRTDNTTANNWNNLFVNHLKKLNIKLTLNDNIEKKQTRVAPAHVMCYKIIRTSSEKYLKLMSRSWFLSCFNNWIHSKSFQICE